MKTRLLTAILAVLCVSALAAETYEIEHWAAGAVGLGWAGFGAALAGPTEYLINPAGLGNAERTDIAGTYVPQFGDRLTPCFGVSFVKPMRTESASLGEERTLGTLAVSLFNATVEIPIYPAPPPVDIPLPASLFEGESLAAISFGSRASELVSYGLNLKVLSVEKDDLADSGFGLDAGVQLYPGDFRFGLAVSNIIPPGISLAAERSFAERVVHFGAGYSLSGILDIAAELEYLPGADVLDYGLGARVVPLNLEDVRIALGGAYRVVENLWGGFLSLRVGVFEATCAVQLDVNGFLVSSLRFAFSPDI
jgi:hypothetical protein